MRLLGMRLLGMRLLGMRTMGMRLMGMPLMGMRLMGVQGPACLVPLKDAGQRGQVASWSTMLHTA